MRPVVAAALIGAFACVLSIAASAQTVDKPARVVSTTIQIGAIVESVNRETREIKLLDARGNRFTVVADERVRNFDQIEPRDRIVAEYLESVAVVVAPQGVEVPLGDAGAVAVAAAGDKPGIEGVQTYLVVGTIESINVSDRQVTVALDDGEVRTFKVADEARLGMVKVGDQVRFRITQALAVNVVRPHD